MKTDSNFRILVVDDTRAVQVFVKSLLSPFRFVQLTSAMNGVEGLQRAKEGPFDLILLDWEMPMMTGPELLKELRGAGIQIPVIMMTSKNAANNIEEMLHAGAAEYIMKPFTLDILLAKMALVSGREFTDAA